MGLFDWLVSRLPSFDDEFINRDPVEKLVEEGKCRTGKLPVDHEYELRWVFTLENGHDWALVRKRP